MFFFLTETRTFWSRPLDAVRHLSCCHIIPCLSRLRNVFQSVHNYMYSCEEWGWNWGVMGCGHGVRDNLLSTTMKWTESMLYNKLLTADQRITYIWRVSNACAFMLSQYVPRRQSETLVRQVDCSGTLGSRGVWIMLEIHPYRISLESEYIDCVKFWSNYRK